MKVFKNNGNYFIRIPKQCIELYEINRQDKFSFVVMSNKDLTDFQNYEDAKTLKLYLRKSHTPNPQLRITQKLLIPKKVVSQCGIKVGDILDFYFVDGRRYTDLEFNITKRRKVIEPEPEQPNQLSKIDCLNDGIINDDIDGEDIDKDIVPQSMFVPTPQSKSKQVWVTDKNKVRKLITVAQ